MSWTINENSKTSTTEYFNATHTDISAGDGESADTAFKNVAGYVSGTINFVVSPAPDSGGGTAWAAGSTLEISIIGEIGSGFTPSQAITFGVHPILEITEGDLNSTFSIEWDIPLEEVSLHINNATLTPTGREITIENISMQTESQGGGVGHMTTSLGPLAFAADPHTSLQYNDSGTFGGASGALYDKNANTSTGQIKLTIGSASVPILAFSDGTHPGGNYDTGIFRAAVGAVGFSAGGDKIVGVYGTDDSPFIKGLNVGVDAALNICGIRRLSATVANSWEDGWMGNSSQLVFTGSDFTNYNTTGGVPQEFAVASADIAGGTGFVMGQTAGADGNEIIAVKLLPKGFRVQRDATVSVATADQTPASVWNNTATIHLATQDINIPTNPSSSFGTATMATWSAAGMNTDLTTVAASSVGNGTIAVVVIITILNTFQIDFTSSLIGVIVPIERQ